MATNTYVALDKVTVSSNTNAVTFTSIPQGYTDLVLVAAAKDSNNYTGMRVNGDTGSNYSRTIMTWNGSSAGSSRTTSANTLYIGGNDTNPEVSIYNFQNYSNTTTYKTILGTQKIANATSIAAVGLWRSTSAITSINIYSVGGTSILAGSTFSLYGIRAEGVSPAPKATGGAIYSDSTYYYHVFGSTGTFTPLQSLTADVLVIAGGGGGSGDVGGGGGAGGILYAASKSLTTTGYTCTVGAGGTGGVQGGTDPGTNGVDSYFDVLRAFGGGKGANFTVNGFSGGSGGGAAGGGSPSLTGGSSTQTSNNGGTGYGNAGGNTFYPGGANFSSAGGGGAGAVGGNNDGTTGGGNGGAGLNTWATWATATGTGVSGYFAGGGGGGGTTVAGTGGAGGGGAGALRSSSSAATAGTVNTGGGGGGDGGGSPSGVGGAGGSGLVIVRYAK